LARLWRSDGERLATEANGERTMSPAEPDPKKPKTASVAGRVPESPRSPDETTSSDGAVDAGVTEDRTPDSGLSADDPDAGEDRKQAYKRGAKLVSRID
jgi:hypothetical protein